MKSSKVLLILLGLSILAATGLGCRTYRGAPDTPSGIAPGHYQGEGYYDSDGVWHEYTRQYPYR